MKALKGSKTHDNLKPAAGRRRAHRFQRALDALSD